MKIQEFKEWLNCCCDDGKEKLNLSPNEIGLILLDKTKEMFLASILKQQDEKKEGEKQ